jgi:hypothetical protein
VPQRSLLVGYPGSSTTHWTQRPSAPRTSSPVSSLRFTTLTYRRRRRRRSKVEFVTETFDLKTKQQQQQNKTRGLYFLERIDEHRVEADGANTTIDAKQTTKAKYISEHRTQNRYGT